MYLSTAVPKDRCVTADTAAAQNHRKHIALSQVQRARFFGQAGPEHAGGLDLAVVRPLPTYIAKELTWQKN